MDVLRTICGLRTPGGGLRPGARRGSCGLMVQLLLPDNRCLEPVIGHETKADWMQGVLTTEAPSPVPTKPPIGSLTDSEGFEGAPQPPTVTGRGP